MRKFLGMVGLCLLTQAGAETASTEDVGKLLVDEFINELVTLQGDFEQALLDADGQLVEKTAGTLEIQRPGRFRWSYTEPYEQWLVADGLNVWSYDVDLEQVTVKPQAQALANTAAPTAPSINSSTREATSRKTRAGYGWPPRIPRAAF